jgi:dUTPase
VAEGDRIAQLVLERIATPEVQEVDVSLFDNFTGLLIFCCSH